MQLPRNVHNYEAQPSHYENMPIQIDGKFYHQKNENFQIKNSDIFHISAEYIDCGSADDILKYLFALRKHVYSSI